MRAAKSVFALLVMAALAQTNAMAQLGKKSLMPEGQLFLPVGNFSPMEKSSRVYGILAVTTGELSFTDGTNYDVDGNGANVALDFKAGNSVFSAGFSTATTELSTTVSGVSIDQESERSSIAARGTFLFGGSGVFVFEAIKADRKVTVGASIGSASISDSADTGLIDISLGASMDISEGIRLAGAFSPEVSDKAAFNGVLAGLEIRSGHGAQIGIGLGYNTPDFAAGLELFLESESQDAASQAASIITATAEMLFGDTSLTGQFVFFQEDPLRIDGALQAPDTEGTVVTVLAKRRIGSAVIGVGISQFDEEGFATGVPSEDADRFDSLSTTSISVRFAADF